MTRCNARTKAGTQCKASAVKGSSKCLFHSKAPKRMPTVRQAMGKYKRKSRK